MKKKWCIAVLAVCMAVAVTGCSGSEKKETKTEGSSEAGTSKSGSKLIDADVSKYVKLGEYKGLELTKEVQDVTDEQIDAAIEDALKTNAKTLGEGETAQTGDIVNIDYVGKVDGKEFDGGSKDGQGTDLELGSGSYVDDFEDQLVGAKAGETRDVNVTFPEEYGSEELAGKDAVFTVTVNSIQRPGELTDEWVAENTDKKTADEYRKSVAENLKKSAEEAAQNNLGSMAWSKLLADVEIEYPDDLVKEETELTKTMMDEQFKAYGIDKKAYLEQMGMSEEDYNAQCEQTAKSNLQMIMTAQAVIDAEGLSLDDEKADKIGKELAADYGYKNAEEAVKQVGEDIFNRNLGFKIVEQFLVDNAKISDGEATPAADDETPEETEE